MQSFNLDHLRTLVKVVETGSFSGAARSLCCSQSAVSKHLQKLEKFAGIILLQRTKENVSLTPAGECLVAHAREMLSASDRAFDDMRMMALKITRARSRIGWRKLDTAKRQLVVQLYGKKECSVIEICQMMGISKPTLYSYVAESSA